MEEEKKEDVNYDHLNPEDKEDISRGLNQICSVCDKEITEEDLQDGNRPTRIKNIPGFVHLFCKGEFDVNLTQTGKNLGPLKPF